MKFSLNLAQFYSKVDLKALPRDELLQRIGAQLGAVEDATDLALKYKDVVAVRVVECGKHPDADKLSVCRIDDGGVTPNVERGEDGLVQVVCGAPNVRANMFAVWIPPGATVPATFDADPFVIEARELRGKVSSGMLASHKELDITDEQGGILEIDAAEVGREPQIGEPVVNFYGLDDFVVACENKMFTHRPDCFGNLGIAREIAGISGLKFESPDWYLNFKSQESRVKSQGELQVEVRNEIAKLVPRFMAVAMSNVEVKKSNLHTRALLRRVGIKPINNVVDITNYIMHLTAQPLHAYDADKLRQLTSHESRVTSLETRMSRKGDGLKLLGGKELVFEDDTDILITSGDVPVGLAGIMGGADTEVDENTKNILIECANFDMYAVRRTSMRHGLFTDAVTRFNKGQSSWQNDRVLAYAMQLMSEFTGAQQASEIYDLQQPTANSQQPRSVEVGVDFINTRLGSDLMPEQIKTLLENVEFKVEVTRDSKLMTHDSAVLGIAVPFWRMDISIAEDIVEEVGRLYGYDKLPVSLPQRTSKPAARNKTRDFARHVRYSLRKAGANEVLSHSFVHGDLLRNTGTDPDISAYHLRNALSPDLQYYRSSLVPSLLAKVHGNIKAQAGRDDNEFAIFEIGKAHIKGEMEEAEPGLPKQMRRLALVITADSKAANKHNGSPFYDAKKYVDLLTEGQASYLPLDTNDYPITAPFQQGRSAIVSVNEQMLGVVGEFRQNTRKSLKLPDYCAGFELDLDLLAKHLTPKKYQPLPTFPSSNQDITFEVANSTPWSELERLLRAELSVARAKSGYNYHLEPLDIFQAESSSGKRISFRIELAHCDKTLKTEEVNSLLDQIAKAADENLSAKRI